MGGRDRGRRARVGGVLSGRLWLAGARPDACRAGGYRAVRAGGKNARADAGAGKTKTQAPAPNEPEPEVPEQSTSKSEVPQADTVQEHSVGETVLGAIWTVLVVLLALCAWQLLLLSLRKAAMGTGSNNKRAVAYWRHIEFLCKLSGSELPQDLRELALKARFSQHKLESGELGVLAAFSDKKNERASGEKRTAQACVPPPRPCAASGKTTDSKTRRSGVQTGVKA